ncbi:hypothetical protein [Vibrio viridaestus]|uniref:Uncharacterized protein n=1 Tax=Vibrio viridaestus TaxID=2487322 RepID=A0A3N9TCE0_9VIBR|nr:hypothetical protein [Vibrio viridaestus]RQW61504.1 hypothetical protein EES38_19380 [Vibrio viridaestus]
MTGKQGLGGLEHSENFFSGVQRITSVLYFIVAVEVALLICFLSLAPISSYWSLCLLVGLPISLLSVIGAIKHSHDSWSVVATSLYLCLFGITFWGMGDHQIHWYIPISLFAVAIVGGLLILPHIDSRLFPSALITLSLLQFVWATLEYWLAERTASSLTACIAALLLCGGIVLYALSKRYFETNTLFSIRTIWLIPTIHLLLYLVLFNF